MISSAGPEATNLRMETRRSFGILVAAVASIGALMFGFDIAIISGASPFIQQAFSLSDLQLGWAVSSLLLGCILGAGVSGHLADRFGRRRLLMAIALVFTASSIATGAAPTLALLVVARILGGTAVGAASMISPLYIAEISPSDSRGRMVSLCQLAITFGILISYVINYLLRDIGSSNWRWMFASGALPSAIFFILLFFVPESPRWLYRRGRRSETLRVLERLAGKASAERELAAMQSAADVRIAACGRSDFQKYWRVIGIGIFLAVLVQLSGMNAVISYAPIILHQAGSQIDSALFRTFIIGAINFAATLVAVLVVDQVGRRILYMAGSLGMTASLILIGLGFFKGSMTGGFGLVSILLFVGSFAACIGPVFWVLMSEMFPSSIRAGAMSIAVLATWLTNFIAILIFPWVLRHLGGSTTFWSISVVPILMFLIAWKFLPETKGRTLEEIDAFWAPDIPA